MEKLKQLIKSFEWEITIKTIVIVLIVKGFWKWVEPPVEDRIDAMFILLAFVLFLTLLSAKRLIKFKEEKHWEQGLNNSCFINTLQIEINRLDGNVRQFLTEIKMLESRLKSLESEKPKKNQKNKLRK